jgi:hypothetical protein
MAGVVVNGRRENKTEEDGRRDMFVGLARGWWAMRCCYAVLGAWVAASRCTGSFHGVGATDDANDGARERELSHLSPALRRRGGQSASAWCSSCLTSESHNRATIPNTRSTAYSRCR